ncbi:MAG TPA: PorV/PorQ family protein [bacterium]
MVIRKLAGNAGSLHSQETQEAAPASRRRYCKRSDTAVLFLLLTVFLLTSVANAQDGGIAGAFLNYGVSPRTLAMGKAFTGLADDQEATYYNPAGLAQLYSHNVKMSYLELWGGRLEYLGYALPTRRVGTIGISVLNFGVDDIDSRDENMNEYSDIRYSLNCVIFSYAFQPVKLFSMGTNFKFVTTKLAQWGAMGIGGDVGLFILPRTNYTFGVTVQNLFGPTLKHTDASVTEADEYPPTFRIGGAIKLYQGKAVIVTDVVKNILDYTSVEPHFGLEFIPIMPLLTLRAGFDKNTVNAGIGLKKTWGKMTLGVDYSIELHHSSSYLLPYRHKIGLATDFGGFRTWIDATPKQFSPTPGRKENVAWLDIHYSSKREIVRWQIVIKNSYGEIVRTYAGWDAPPLRLNWDGLDDVGRLVADGCYNYEIVIIDKGGETINFSDHLTTIKTLGPQGEIEFVPQE